MPESRKAFKDLNGPLTPHLYEVEVDGVVALGATQASAKFAYGQQEGAKSAQPGVEADDPQFVHGHQEGDRIARRARTHFLEEQPKS